MTQRAYEWLAAQPLGTTAVKLHGLMAFDHVSVAKQKNIND